jgi:hypothetical protein
MMKCIMDGMKTKNQKKMSESFYMSITISDKEVDIIKKALTILKNEVVVNPKKHWEVSHSEIVDIMHLIEDKKRWGVPYSANDDNHSE